MADKKEKTKTDDTEGFGVDPQAKTPDKEKAPEIDPRTNQPVTDFTPTLADDHPDADAVKRQDDKIKVASAMGRSNAAQLLIEAREADREKQKLAEESLRTVEESNPLPEREYAMIPPDVYRAREQARVMAKANTLGTSKTVPGGRFKVGDIFVDADGNEIE